LEGKKGQELESLLAPASDSLSDEIRHTLSLYGSMAAEEGIHTIYLSGGSAKVPGLPRLIQEKLDVPVHLSEPFRGFSIAKHIDKDYLQDSASALAVGAGLAIRRPGDK
jgi:type IV pilus assembly protein PilM